MTNHQKLRYTALTLFILGLLTSFLVSWTSRGVVGSCLAVTEGIAWLVLPILVPVLEVTSGKVLEKDGTTHRSEKPLTFWISVITHAVLMLLFAIGASVALYVYFHPLA